MDHFRYKYDIGPDIQPGAEVLSLPSRQRRHAIRGANKLQGERESFASFQ